MQMLDHFLGWIDEGRADRVARILRPHVEGLTLDVGCWNGAVSRRFSHVHIVGIDILIPPNRHIDMLRFDGTRIPFSDKIFDTVLCCTALHHAEDPDALLAEMKRVGRRMVVLEDAYDSLLQRLSVLSLHAIGRLFVPIPYRLKGFRSTSSWRRLFLSHGLDVISHSRYSGIQPGWPFLGNDLYVLHPTP